MKTLINARIYDFESYIESGYVTFEDEILEVGTMDSFSGSAEGIDCKGALVIPGLTNCHTHIYSAFARGMWVPFNPSCFRDILEQLWWKLDSKLDQESIRSSAMVYGMECLLSGVTSIIDHHASGLCIKGSLKALNDAVSKDLGMRGIYCFESSDRFPLEKCIEENIEFAVNCGDNTGSLFGLHASMSLSNESLQSISRHVGKQPIHIHVAESIDDVLDSRRKYKQSIVERLDSYGLLNPGSILAHCVHINEQDAEIIAKRGCYVALNPTSNMNNAVGLPDFRMLKRHGIKCLLGNDGLGANITRDCLNLLYSMKNKLGSPTEFLLEDLVEVLNNGYQYLSDALHIKLGKIEQGYKADLLVVPYNPPTPINTENMLGHLIYGVFDSFKPRQVWLSGKLAVDNYTLVAETQMVYTEAINQAAMVWERLDS